MNIPDKDDQPKLKVAMADIDKMIKILTAFKNGEVVEVFNEVHKEWRLLTVPLFDFYHNKYRIPPTLRKFTLEWGEPVRWICNNGLLKPDEVIELIEVPKD